MASIGGMDGLGPRCDFPLPVKPQARALVIGALLTQVRGIIEKSGDTHPEKSHGNGEVPGAVPERLQQAGLDGSRIRIFHELAQKFSQARNPLVITGQDLTASRDAAAFQDAVQLALLMGPRDDKIMPLITLKPYGNSAGAWRLGLAAAREMPAGDMPKGLLLMLAGEHSLPADILSRVRKLDFLAVLGPYLPVELLTSAHVVIPTPVWLETGGTYTSLDGREIAYKEKVLNAPTGFRDAWQTLNNLVPPDGPPAAADSWEHLRVLAGQAFQRDTGFSPRTIGVGC